MVPLLETGPKGQKRNDMESDTRWELKDAIDEMGFYSLQSKQTGIRLEKKASLMTHDLFWQQLCGVKVPSMQYFFYFLFKTVNNCI